MRKTQCREGQKKFVSPAGEVLLTSQISGFVSTPRRQRRGISLLAALARNRARTKPRCRCRLFLSMYEPGLIEASGGPVGEFRKGKKRERLTVVVCGANNFTTTFHHHHPPEQKIASPREF